ncbi:MAG: DUF2911 domain-containing protein [Flavobacteriaceae bacterium]|nr:MAG: DUF2911 domain-containing protein [Flavobacteriaceae bacterium]
MKNKLITSVLICALLSTVFSYAQTFEKLDEAPVDIAYLTHRKDSKPLVKVVYGRPQKETTQVFGDQVPFGEIWRTGANEATEVKFYTDMSFGRKLVKAGTYVMHTIPGEKEWIIILNSKTDTWGSFFYDEAKDVVRIKVPSRESAEIDVFSIGFKEQFNNMYMVLGWDSTRVDIPLATQDVILAKL